MVKTKMMKIIYVKRCTEPNEKVKQIYSTVKYQNYPFTKRTSVVHKSEIKKNGSPNLCENDDGYMQLGLVLIRSTNSVYQKSVLFTFE